MERFWFPVGVTLMPWLTRAVQETMRSGRDVQRSPGFERRLRPDRLNQQPAGPTHLCPATDGETPNLVCGVAGPTEDVMAINPSAVRMQRSAHHSAAVTWMPRPTTSSVLQEHRNDQ